MDFPAVRLDFEVLERVRLDCADPINNSLRRPKFASRCGSGRDKLLPNRSLML
jgi:hypothetical protein